MTDVLKQIVGQIGNVFESLTQGVSAVISDAGEFLGNLS